MARLQQHVLACHQTCASAIRCRWIVTVTWSFVACDLGEVAANNHKHMSTRSTAYARLRITPRPKHTFSYPALRQTTTMRSLTLGIPAKDITYERRTAVRCLIINHDQICIIHVKKGELGDQISFSHSSNLTTKETTTNFPGAA